MACPSCLITGARAVYRQRTKHSSRKILPVRVRESASPQPLGQINFVDMIFFCNPIIKQWGAGHRMRSFCSDGHHLGQKMWP